MTNDIDWLSNFGQQIDAVERAGASNNFVASPSPQYGKILRFRDDAFYQLAGAGPSLSSGGVVLLAFTRETSGDATTEITFSRQTISTRGWALNLRDGTPGRAFARAHTTVPASVTEQNDLPSLTVGEIQRLYMVIDTDDNLLEVYLNGTIMSAGAALASFAPPTTEDLVIGERVSGSDVYDWGVVAFGVTDTVMTAAQISAWDDSIVAGNGWQSTTGELSYLLEGKDGGGVSWEPARGSGTLAITGANSDLILKENIPVPVWSTTTP